ncbi:6,7-dimethyl-8-ribityllumazine synthase [Rickettsiella massiliensis]|uniref:6,7-dimethyl-8-ribityllumazine synthase n=1 Tax=Rickettsiella massiliensis TaxID=676517 RepID=UPI000496FEB1|nr:6,7-dimethyl-8-ribityllumazine synthase [Rickettsiella massiliensis]
MRQSPCHLAIVVSRFNEEITEALLHSAQARLTELQFPNGWLTLVRVPGAIEIGITAQQLALTGRYHALICLGAVIRGETSHYDYVCQQVSDACQQIALQQKIPATENEEQAFARINKGAEAVNVALEMISILSQIRG